MADLQFKRIRGNRLYARYGRIGLMLLPVDGGWRWRITVPGCKPHVCSRTFTLPVDAAKDLLEALETILEDIAVAKLLSEDGDVA